MKKNVKLQNAELSNSYGLYLQINSGFQAMIDKQMLCDATNKVEVCVDVFGEKKEFTLNEFLSRLGFDRQMVQPA